MTQILWARYFNVLKRINFTYQFTNTCRREKELIKIMHEFTRKIIDERRTYIEKYGNNFDTSIDQDIYSGPKKKLAFLDLLLQVQGDHPEKLNNEGIREEVDTFLFEGHDTTTSAISFALLNLAKYPDAQQLVFEESQNILGDKMASTIQDLNQLTYLEKFIKETLRLYPSVRKSEIFLEIFYAIFNKLKFYAKF